MAKWRNRILQKVSNLAGSAIQANKDILCVPYIVSLIQKNLQIKHTLILAVFLPYHPISYRSYTPYLIVLQSVFPNLCCSTL